MFCYVYKLLNKAMDQAAAKYTCHIQRDAGFQMDLV